MFDLKTSVASVIGTINWLHSSRVDQLNRDHCEQICKIIFGKLISREFAVNSKEVIDDALDDIKQVSAGPVKNIPTASIVIS